MPRNSLLHPHKDAISEALTAGTSVANLARTYGVHRSSMAKFIASHIRGDVAYYARELSRANRRYRTLPSRRLQVNQYDSLRYQRQQAELSRQRAEEAL